jgi:DNA-binding CsgD family transcriptional regulator
MMLLERADHLEQLTNHLRQAGAGHGRVVLIAGEAGVGKSALVDEFCERAAPEAHIMRTSCDALSTPGPFGPLLDIAPALGIDPKQLFAPNTRRDELFYAVFSALRTQPETVVIVGEDAHWSDEASIDLLRFLSRRIGTLKVLFLVTYRDDEISPFHPLQRLLGDLASASTVQRLTLAPLSLDAVRALAGGTGHDPSELHRRSGGNPFFVTEVLASNDAELPRTVSDAVLARTARLSPEALAALQVAAVIGTFVDTGILLRVAGPVFNALEECIAGGLMRHGDERLAFRHEIGRDAVLATIAEPRRRLLHQRVLEALQAEPSTATSFARLAHHAEACGNVVELRIYALAAAEQASAAYAHREAAAQYARLLRVADGLDDREQATLLEKYAYACYLSAQGDAAIVARQSAVDRWRRLGEPLSEAENLRWISRLCWFQGQNEEALRAGTAALEVLEQLPPGPEFAMACSNMAQLKMLTWDVPDAVSWGNRAIELAEALGERETLIHALANVGTARGILGESEGLAQIEQSARMAVEDGFIDHAGRGLTNLAWTYLELFRLAEAEHHFQVALNYAIEFDLDSYRWYLTAGRAILRCYLGDWEGALRDVDQVLAVSVLSPLTRIVALTARGQILGRRGDAAAVTTLDEALALAERTGELQRLGRVRLARSEAAWFAGDMRAALDEADALRPLVERVGTPWLRGELAISRARAGAEEIAIAGVAEPFADMLRGEWRRAAEFWQQIGCRFEHAYALARIDDEAAIRQAEAIFADLGALPAKTWAQKRLREIGVRLGQRGPRPSTQANLAGLTAREMEVLELLAAGLSNAAIADRLFISRKTAGHHVSAILAKLGVESRMAAVLRSAELGQPHHQK